MIHDCLVVGAGPAGMAAATLLARQGADVVVLDDQPAPGGQIWRGIEAAPESRRAILGASYAAGAPVVAAFRASGADYRPASAVWQITPEREIWVSQAGRSTALRGRTILLATGALERPVPLPGWTLPGVMTAGALQIMLKSSGLAPRSAILAGSGPLLYQLAAQCIAAGTPPAAVLDTAPRATLWPALPMLAVALSGHGPRYLRQGLMLQGALRAHGIAWHRGVTDLELEGNGQVAAVRFLANGLPLRLPASLVALHEGVIPAQHATRLAGCAHQWDSAQSCFRPVLDRWGNSTVADILVAGDAAGIGGAEAALAAGRVAAIEILHRLGRIGPAMRDEQAAAPLRDRADHLAIRPFLDRRYPPPATILSPADDVVACRCEEVTAGALRRAVAQGCQGPNQAKAFTRAGMGPCQGRLCGPSVSTILATARGMSPDETGHFRIRPPLRPITLGELAEPSPSSPTAPPPSTRATPRR